MKPTKLYYSLAPTGDTPSYIFMDKDLMWFPPFRPTKIFNSLKKLHKFLRTIPNGDIKDTLRIYKYSVNPKKFVNQEIKDYWATNVTDEYDKKYERYENSGIKRCKHCSTRLEFCDPFLEEESCIICKTGSWIHISKIGELKKWA